ncbi:MAG: hypothetical protein IJR32_03320 [Paludibacteraceae bacterium]|jgi:hypothetical protein|nr:hypothetical protein [Paludibacteraceae bacterium]MCR4619608.1 hypothetical protein [Paludibacteraceae bacterium]
MKKLILLGICAISLILTSCHVSTPVAQQTGKEDVAFLLFVSTSNESNYDVDVQIDDTHFTATTVKSRQASRKGTQYSVQPGNRSINVKRGGQTVYQKDLFLSPREVRQILLP